MRKNILKSRVADFLSGNRPYWPVIIIALVTAGGCIATSFAVRAYNKEVYNLPATIASPSAQPAFKAPGSQSPDLNPTEIAVVTIRPTGFEPAEIIRSKGTFFLAVENRSGLQTIQLRIDGETGNRVQEARVPGRKHDWHQSFNLPPGRYKLTEVNHPDWSCTIIVESK